MLRHVVMWRLKDEAEGRNKEANAARIMLALRELPAKIPEIIMLEVGQDALGAEGSYDLVLMVDLADQRALESYMVHPEHVKVAQLVTRLRDCRAVVDYEL
jgi:hypothetical protein